MGFEIDDPRAEQLAHQLAAVLGVSVDEAVLIAVRERLHRVRAERQATVASPPDENP